jgi:hypothetical protein
MVMALTKPKAAADVVPSEPDAATIPRGGPVGVHGFEWKTRAQLWGLPLVCIAFGADSRGRPRVAKGWIALGQFAVGVVVVAQFGLGLISLGQVALGVAAGGQLAVGLVTGMGQMAIGAFAVGQVVIGVYGKGQVGWADYLWSPGRTDMEAVAMFETLEWLVRQDLGTIWENVSFEIVMTLQGIAGMFR